MINKHEKTIRGLYFTSHDPNSLNLLQNAQKTGPNGCENMHLEEVCKTLRGLGELVDFRGKI